MASRTLFTFLFAVAASCGLVTQAKGAAPADFGTTVRPFLAEHCVDCHGPDKQKAGLRLDTLAADFDQREPAETWTKVLDKVAAGQMPPPKKDRPPAAATAAVTGWLGRQLHDASLARQRREGRVVLRRLNGTEYENTLRDLLATPVEVTDLLPEDNAAGGFDNVSTVLDLSSAHLLRYQEAAEHALAAAVPTRAPKTIKTRLTGRAIYEKQDKTRSLIFKLCRVGQGKDADSLMMYVQLPSYAAVAFPAAEQAGRYRLRLSARVVGTGGKPLPVVFDFVKAGARTDGDVRACQDVPGTGESFVIDQELELRPREALQVNAWTLPTEQEIRQKYKMAKEVWLPDDYAGPALAIEWMEIEGPINPFPGEGYRRLFGDLPLKPKSVAKAEADGTKVPKIPEKRSDYDWNRDPLVPVSAHPREDAGRLLRAFIPRAFRRPAGEDVVAYYTKFAHGRLDKGYDFPDAMLATYKAVLCSPHFLFLEERPGKLDDYALAARLSYFLWSGPPDDELLAAAAKGGLTGPDGPAAVDAQVDRMLKHPRAGQFVENFAGQWLDLRKVNATTPDPRLYGEFDPYLLWSMPRETEAFFTEVLDKDLGVASFVDSDWTFLNARLATHYGVPGVDGSAVRKVKLPAGSHRGGVMTQASVLKVTADGTRTSPVLRGKWVLDRIIGKPPAPPPPDVPAIEPDIRGATTIRQQLDKHRNTPACASCHVHIDPPGFALETYDPIGGWRDFYRVSQRIKQQAELPNYPGRKVWRGPDVDQGDKTPEGKPFKDVDEYKRILLEDKDQLARNVVQKVMTYATGAEPQFADREVVEQVVADVRKKDYGLRSIVHAVVRSRAFVNK